MKESFVKGNDIYIATCDINQIYWTNKLLLNWTLDFGKGRGACIYLCNNSDNLYNNNNL